MKIAAMVLLALSLLAAPAFSQDQKIDVVISVTTSDDNERSQKIVQTLVDRFRRDDSISLTVGEVKTSDPDCEDIVLSIRTDSDDATKQTVGAAIVFHVKGREYPDYYANGIGRLTKDSDIPEFAKEIFIAAGKSYTGYHATDDTQEAQK